MKKVSRRLFAVLAAVLALCFVLSACSQNTAATEAAESTKASTVDEVVPEHDWILNEQRVFNLAYSVSSFDEVDSMLTKNDSGDTTAKSLTYTKTDSNGGLEWTVGIQGVKNTTLSAAITKYVGEVDEIEGQKFNNIDFRVFCDSDYGTYYACCLIDNDAYIVFFCGNSESLQVFAEFLNSVKADTDHGDTEPEFSLAPMSYAFPENTETHYEIKETADRGIIYKSAGFGSMTNEGALIEYKPDTTVNSVISELISTDTAMRVSDAKLGDKECKLWQSENKLSRRYFTEADGDVYAVSVMWRDGSDEVLNSFLNSIKFSK